MAATTTTFRATLALAAGIFTGTILAVIGVEGPVDAVTHTARLLTGASGAGSMWRIVIVAEWKMALIYSAITGAVAALIWAGLARTGRNRLLHGVALGLVLGAIAGALVFFKSSDDPSAEYLEKIAVFALVGAASGAVTWLTGRGVPPSTLSSRP